MARTDPERIPNGPRTDPERTPNQIPESVPMRDYVETCIARWEGVLVPHPSSTPPGLHFFGLRSGSVRASFGFRSGSVWGPFGGPCGSARGLCGVRSGSVRSPFGVRSGSVRGPFGVRSGFVRGPFGVRSGCVRGPCRVRAGSVRELCRGRRSQKKKRRPRRGWVEQRGWLPPTPSQQCHRAAGVRGGSSSASKNKIFGF